MPSCPPLAAPLSLPIFFKSYSSSGLTLKPTFNNGFDLLDFNNGLALIIQ